MCASFGRFLQRREGARGVRSPLEDGSRGGRRSRVVLLIAGCGLLSLALHFFAGLGLDLRSPEEELRGRLVLLRFDPPPPPKEIESPPAKAPVAAATDIPAQSGAQRPAVRNTSKRMRKTPVKKTVAKASKPAEPRAESKPLTMASERSAVPVGRIEARPGVTVLANESGQDTLKHGAEARFMHGAATEEFVEDNYVGEYTLKDEGRIWIEDDRSGSGHLVLHAEALGLHRRLFRFNRFIYVYGPAFDSPEPVQGTVTFFSDGYHIHQFLLQHESSKAYFPRRK